METPQEKQSFSQAAEKVLSEPVTPVVTPEVTPVVENNAEDILKRVSGFQDENEEKVEVPQDFKFDVNEINNIKDPTARKYAEDAYKSFQKGFNTKFQELAELRKGLESNIEQNKQPSTWTTEKVQSLLNDASFVQAAQNVANVPESDEYSALSDAEKAKLGAMEKEVLQIKALHNQMLKQQQDVDLKGKYVNYDPGQIDTLTADLIAGNVQATREHLYKIVNHDDNIRRAYELGRKDEKHGINEKVSQTSTEGVTAVATEANLVKEQSESSESFFSRLARKNLAKIVAQK